MFFFRSRCAIFCQSTTDGHHLSFGYSSSSDNAHTAFALINELNSLIQSDRTFCAKLDSGWKTIHSGPWVAPDKVKTIFNYPSVEYDCGLCSSLVRFLRNCMAHYHEKKGVISSHAWATLWALFTTTFPALLPFVYDVVSTLGPDILVVTEQGHIKLQVIKPQV